MDICIFGFFRLQQYAPDYSQKCDNKYFVGFYALKTYSAILSFLGMLEHICFYLFPKFLNYKNNKNTYKYIVLFRIIIDYIMETFAII